MMTSKEGKHLGHGADSRSLGGPAGAEGPRQEEHLGGLDDDAQAHGGLVDDQNTLRDWKLSVDWCPCPPPKVVQQRIAHHRRRSVMIQSLRNIGV